jgi:hypothetical protein
MWASFSRRAGSSFTAEEFRARLSSLSYLVFSEIWRNEISVGEMRKGDYVFINHMKVPNVSAYMELERAIWKPMAESWVKDGMLHGWSISRPMLPSGNGVKYQAVTVDVMPSWDGAFKPLPLEATFKKVHPDKNMDEVLDKLGKARSLDLRELMVVDDKIVPAGKASAGGD